MCQYKRYEFNILKILTLLALTYFNIQIIKYLSFDLPINHLQQLFC